jgi:beta-glucosidase-like glycosyl hydrolase
VNYDNIHDINNKYVYFLNIMACMRQFLVLSSILAVAGLASATPVPGLLQAEDYDVGGEGAAYHDTTAGNTGGAYRSEDVDIEANGPGAFHVAYVAPGEWLRYTIEATNDFRARLRHRVASNWPNGPYAWRVSLDERTVDVQNGYPTGGWTTFTTVTSPLPFEVTAGIHTLRVDFILGEFNVDQIEVVAETNAPLPYQDSLQPVTNRVADLMARMTVAEKVGQLCLAGVEWLTQYEGTDIVQQQHQERDIATHRIGALLNGAGGGLTGQAAPHWADMTDRYQGYALSTPLGIPVIYGVDAVHGHGNVPGATIFPHNIGLGASGRSVHAERAAQVTAVEVRATGMHWVYAPALTVARDERWGRFYEAFGETPAQATAMGLAALRGYQGSDLAAATSVLASIKHFAGDGGTQWGSGRDGKIDQGNVVLDEAAFRALHLAPYSNAVAAGALNVMASYSSWNGQKMHNHTNLLTGVLKGEFGFPGFIVSDWGGVDQVFGNYAQSLVACINAGLDMVMVPGNYLTFLGHVTFAVNQNSITAERLDDAVRRILTVKFELGLFERPFADRSLLARVGSAEHRAAARAAVRDSLVILKNDGDLLPLPKDLPRVHVARPQRRQPGPPVRRVDGVLAGRIRRHHHRHDHLRGHYADPSHPPRR